jgi:flagellar assembly protein FliH
MSEGAKIMSASQVNLAAILRQPAGFRAAPFAIASFLSGGDSHALPGEETIDAAFARGVEEGKQLAEISHAAERKALLDLLASAEAFHHDSSDDLAAMIAETVARLVDTIVTAAPVERQWLEEQAAAAAAIIAEADRDRILFMNPADAALVDADAIGLPIRTDPKLNRGDVRIETGAGWVEAGRSVYLDALRQALGLGGAAA